MKGKLSIETFQLSLFVIYVISIRSFVERYHLFGKIRLPLLARHGFAKSKTKHFLNNHNSMLSHFCWTFLVAAVILFEKQGLLSKS